VHDHESSCPASLRERNPLMINSCSTDFIALIKDSIEIRRRQR
jgi:hypothetical protein